MAVQGWYPAPGETGYLRYWGGSAWTDHRQPIPVAAAPVVPAAAAAAPVGAPPGIAMDQFEQLYEQREAAQFAAGVPAAVPVQPQYATAAVQGYQPAAVAGPHPQAQAQAQAQALASTQPAPSDLAAPGLGPLVADIQAIAAEPEVQALG
jgi:hypothetical protein